MLPTCDEDLKECLGALYHNGLGCFFFFNETTRAHS